MIWKEKNKTRLRTVKRNVREAEKDESNHPTFPPFLPQPFWNQWNIVDTPLFCFPSENQYRRSAAPLGGEVALAGDKSQCPENPC